MNVQDSKVKETIYSELHNNLVLTYGIASTGIRLGSLIDLIQDFNVKNFFDSIYLYFFVCS